ncbi:MAG: VWA domain-containing protein [Proteobacteria bacterium]|nr:VWA domain-containing protein [Pseudomonadota bacterium]
MRPTVRTVIFWLIVLLLIAIQGAAFLHFIWMPGIETLEFTNVDVITRLNALPFVSMDVPASEPVQYCAFHLYWLGLFAFWPLLLLPARHSLCDFPLWQRILSVICRVAILALLVLALTDIEKTSETSLVSVVYVVDVSSSVPDDMLEAAHQEIETALSQKTPETDIQVVTFASEPKAVQIGENNALPAFERQEAGAGQTDIESALRFSYALFPENHVRRIVLLGDGNQTKGDALSEAARAKAQGIRIDVVHLKAEPVREIMVKSLEVRDRDNLRVGKPFEAVLEISSTHEASVHLDVAKNGIADDKLSQDVALVPGENFVTITTAGEAPGALELKFALSGIPEAEDRFAENNALIDKLDIQGKPKVLYIEQNASNASYLQRALAGYGASSGQDFDVEVRSASGMPTSMKEIMKYSAVILGDVPRETNTGRTNVTTESMNLLQEYVKRQGGGFIALGGEEALGPGGYENTPVEKILPVSFKNETPRQTQSAAIALVIDKSGSMRENRNLEIAKEAAKASVSALKAQDRVTVVGFDDAPYVFVPMTRAVNRYSINDKISRMQPNGGTNIRDALEMTYLELAMVSAKTKHVILLTDGRSPYSGIDALVREMARAKITVSTVALANADTTLLSRIANLGKGRAYVAKDASSVPRIFVEETNRVANQAVVETPFVPQVARQHDMIKGVTMQTLLGYVGTKAKSGSQTILTAPGGAPVLAHWSLGSGKTTVFTSDAKNRWASAWIKQSASFSKFWAQVVRSTMKADEETRYEMRAERENDTIRLIVDAISDQDSFMNGLDITADVTRPDGEHFELKLAQTAPGFYENTFVMPVYGTYQAQAELKQQGESLGYARKTFSYPYAQEFADTAANAPLLDAVAGTTGGRIDAPFAESADPEGEKIRSFTPIFYYFLFIALACLVADVFFKRVRLARSGRRRVPA